MSSATISQRGPASAPQNAPATPATPALSVKNLTVRYHSALALENVTFDAQPGELVGVIGPNGAGKSTVMKAILGLIPIEQGEIRILGQSVGGQRRRIGYMPQQEQVDWDFPVTVADVTLMGRYARRGLLRWATRADKEAAAAALERVGMQDLRHRLIGELSGGQRRRALLARALAIEPDLLLMDEPMAGLDATAQHALLEIVAKLQAEGTAVLMSTHDLSCVATTAHRVVCLNRRLVAFGPPAEVLTERILNQTFGAHLLLVHVDGQAYAYQHHTHQPGGLPSPDANGASHE